MAMELSNKNDVRLLSFTRAERAADEFEVIFVEAGDNVNFAPHEEWADVIVFQGHAMIVFEKLNSTRKIIVVDIYDPMHLEQLEQARELPFPQWTRQVEDATAVLNQQLDRGDFFICASERQRLFWLGQLAALGRVNPLNYTQDPDLKRLIDVAPFGLSRVEPHHSKNVVKGVVPGISSEDKLLLWSGGLYNWFDPHTLILAVSEISSRRPNVKLYFQGTKHPHPGVPEMEIVRSSRELAQELGLLDKNVFFNDNWVDFDERQNYLLEADLGVSTHHSHIETTFSFRTRILDYLWAGLPMVITQGDHFGDLVSENQLGIAVEAGNVAVLAHAIEKMLFDIEFRESVKKNIQRTRQEYFWDVVLMPLVRFIESPTHSSDHEGIETEGFHSRYVGPSPKNHFRFTRYVKSSISIISEQGLGAFFQKIWFRIK